MALVQSVGKDWMKLVKALLELVLQSSRKTGSVGLLLSGCRGAEAGTLSLGRGQIRLSQGNQDQIQPQDV